MTNSTQTVKLNPDLELRLTRAGTGRPALVLHGGAGPASVGGLAAHLAESMQAITPTHPGFDGTARPSSLASVAELAQAYLQYLSDAGLRDVLVVGSSVGGWIGAEMALQDSRRLISGLILLDAGGIAVDDAPSLNVFALEPARIFEAAFYDPAKFAPNPSSMTPERIALQRSNMATLRVLAGEAMTDPTLRDRLKHVFIPTLVLWGAADGVVTPAYGRAYAAAFADAQFEMIERAGHLPHVEQPAATYALIDQFMQSRAAASSVR